MDYRHEWKFEMNAADVLTLRMRLKAVMSYDKHTVDGLYTIRSLYFDTASDKALREKIDGVNKREKFRIRYYNGDKSLIKLEKKSKLNGLGNKQTAKLSEAEVTALLMGDRDWMREHSSPLVREFYAKMAMEGLNPKTVVDYTREAYTYPAGNVRVTIDSNIRTAVDCTQFLDPDCVTIPAGDAPTIIEVKWDGFLPDIIKDAVSVPNRRVGAFSKYAQCRIYG